jgi:cytochrome P450
MIDRRLKVVVVVTYRITVHPLARYPGPLLSKITSISVFIQAISGDRHIISLREHEKYGPVVRIAPNQLSFSTSTALRLIYQSGRQNNPLRKSPWYETIDAPSGAYSTHTEISRIKHAFRRRVLEHAFSDSALRSVEEFVIENVDVLCKVVAEQHGGGEWSKPLNMSEKFTWLAYDIMGDLVFGRKFDCLTATEHRFVPKLLLGSSAFIYAVGFHVRFMRVLRVLN